MGPDVCISGHPLWNEGKVTSAIAQSVTQVCDTTNSRKWCHLVAKFVTNANGATWWPNQWENWSSQYPESVASPFWWQGQLFPSTGGVTVSRADFFWTRSAAANRSLGSGARCSSSSFPILLHSSNPSQVKHTHFAECYVLQEEHLADRFGPAWHRPSCLRHFTFRTCNPPIG